MNAKEGFAKGLTIRKEVLGEEYVNNSLSNADEFSMPLQEYVTEHAWGAVCDRPGLTKKQRRMITLSILVAH